MIFYFWLVWFHSFLKRLGNSQTTKDISQGGPISNDFLANLVAPQKTFETLPSIGNQLLEQVSQGNPEALILAQDFCILRRQNYTKDFQQIPDGIWSFFGVASQGTSEFQKLCKPQANSLVLSATSVIFQNGSVQFQRRHLPKTISKDANFSEFSASSSGVGFSVITSGSTQVELPQIVTSRIPEIVGEIEIFSVNNSRVNSISPSRFDYRRARCYFSHKEAVVGNHSNLTLVEWAYQSGEKKVWRVFRKPNIDFSDEGVKPVANTSTPAAILTASSHTVHFTANWVIILVAPTNPTSEPVSLWLIEKHGLFVIFFSFYNFKISQF